MLNNSYSLWRIFLGGVVTMTLSLCAQSVLAQDGKEVVAKLGAVELTANDVKFLIDAQPPEIRLRLQDNAQLLDRLVRTEVFRQVLADEARKKQFDKKPETAAAMRREADKVLVSLYVNELARPPAGYPSEQEIQEAYKANSEALKVPEQFHVAQIFVSSPTDTDPKEADVARKKIDGLSRAAQRNVKFEELAERHSDHEPSASKGGDLGWVTLDQMVPAIGGVVAKLKKGEVSAPVRTESGWHIVKLLDQKPASIRPYAEVKDELTRLLRLRKAQENERKYFDELVARTPLGVNEIALNRLIVDDKEPKK